MFFVSVTREWTRVAVHGPAPSGRYGHAVAMVNTKFYVFGGQVDGEFLNDLWAFDLNTRELVYRFVEKHWPDRILVRTKATWELIKPNTPTEGPAKRTGHVCVSFGDRIIMLFLFPYHPWNTSAHNVVISVGLAAQTRSTTITILWHLTSTLESGLS